MYALDSTTIDLCLALFPWAKFRIHRGAFKLHNFMDLWGNIPSFITNTDCKVHHVNILDVFRIGPGSFYIMDHGYIDYERLYPIHKYHGYFVIRGKSNLLFRRQYSSAVDKTTGFKFDQHIMLSDPKSSINYPEPLRRINYTEPVTDETYVFFTNNFEHASKVITDLYKSR